MKEKKSQKNEPGVNGAPITSRNQGRCFVCNQAGHKKFQCKALNCVKCGKLGHEVKSCYAGNAQKYGTRSTNAAVAQKRETIPEEINKSACTAAEVAYLTNGTELPLINGDHGSTGNLIKKNYADTEQGTGDYG